MVMLARFLLLKFWKLNKEREEMRKMPQPLSVLGESLSASQWYY